MHQWLSFDPEPFEGYQVFDELALGAERLLETTAVKTSPVYRRWVQCALNSIADSRLALTGTLDAPTEAAVKSFQQSRGLVADGIPGPKTVAKLLAAGAAPPPTTTVPPRAIATPAMPPFRPCCMLAPSIPLAGSNIVDPTRLGTHRAADEANGIFYTGGAGFIDLGHVREVIDLVKLVHDQLVAGGGFPNVVLTIHGEASICCPVPTARFVKVASALAFDDALGHEILTYDIFHQPGGHNSAFSPEDLPSNFLGTIVGARAIAAGGSFNAAATAKLRTSIAALKPQAPVETGRALQKVNGRWIDFTSANSILRDDYLKRRNFGRKPFKTGHKSDAATPAWMMSAFGPEQGFYSYTNTRGRTFTKAQFPTEIRRIKADAARRYGADFDKP